MLGGVNPVYTAPADLKFAEKLAKVDLSRLSRAVRRRNRVPLPLEHSGRASARELGRCARVRRHRHASSSRSSRRSTKDARRSKCWRLYAAARSTRLRDRQGLLDAGVRRRRGWTIRGTRRPAVQERRHVLAPRAPRRVHRRHRDRRWRTGDTVCRRARACGRTAGSAARRAILRSSCDRAAAAATVRRCRARAAAARQAPGATARRAADVEGGLELIFRPDPDGVGRPFREQRLAAGTAQAADEGHVGRDGVDQPAAREGPRPRTTATSSS